MKKILVCFGTRPEIIKLAPVISELIKNNRLRVYTCSTAQHVEMLKPFMKNLAIIPDHDLGIMSANQSLCEMSEKIFARFPAVLDKVKPDLIVVQGDTTSACVIAQVAFLKHIPVAHVEAGLRTHDKALPFPEEMNRRIITQVADFHFAPTKIAYDNLINEGVKKNSIYLTGNTIVDALISLRAEVDKITPSFEVKLKRKFILVTIHRRETIGRPLTIICQTIYRIAKRYPDLQIVFPVHLNPQVQKVVKAELSKADNILLLPPVEYLELLYLLSRCVFVMTDSGGIQEEAPSFGKPVLVLRTVTERGEGVDLGLAKLVGHNPKAIVREVDGLLTNSDYYQSMVAITNPYGDGKAGYRISEIIGKTLI